LGLSNNSIAFVCILDSLSAKCTKHHGNSYRSSPRSLEDVANSLGVKGNRSIFKVVLPIAAPGILAGAALVALTVLKELPATLLLRPTGTETLAVRLWSSTEELAFAQAAPYALLLVVLGGLPALALNRQARKALSEVSN
jgi:iron(III) transport system permease protein